jgi:DNA adenine methylase
VGGKRQLTTKLLSLLPADARERRYIEPFVGAGSLFFALRPQTAVLSDLNRHLIECYRHIRDNHKRVGNYLKGLAAANSEEHYYRVRDAYNLSSFTSAQAARFIYLNRVCFNGVFRVNRDGFFNVPFGDKPNALFPSAKELAAISQALKKTDLRSGDYLAVLKHAHRGDLVYLDPPYPPLNGTSNFTHYTADRFSFVEQERLADAVESLNQLGCRVIMTNADLPVVRRLYRGYSITAISVRRYVTCKKIRHSVGELVITNYRPSPRTP